MPQDILNFMVVQSTPSGSRGAPAMLVFSTGGGQDPENVAANIFGIGFENISESLAWRQYDRVIRHHNDVSGVQFWVWIRNSIQFLSAGWAAAHTIAGMDGQRDFGLHTGLYHVTQRDGTEHICGLYAAQFVGTGFVKYDPRTDTWTSGPIAGSSIQSGTMGMCIPFRGKLYHVNNVLQEYDPLTNTIQEYPIPGGGGRYAKLAVAGGRLFILPTSGQGRLCELVFGAVFTVALFATENFGAAYSAGGDNLMKTGLTGPNSLEIFWFCAQNGYGFRCQIAQVDPLAPGSPVGAFNESGVFPDYSIDSLDNFMQGEGVAFFGAFPAVATANRRMFTDGAWQLSQGPLFSATPLAFQMLKLTGFRDSAFGTIIVPPGPTIIPGEDSSYTTYNLVPPVWPLGYPSNRHRVDWRGTNRVMSYVDAPDDHSVSLTHSQVTSPWGSAQRTFGNGPTVTAFTFEPYSDAVVSRGMRVTFKIANSTFLGDAGSDLYFGYARHLGRPATRMSLETGINPVASYPGGVATFWPATNRLQNVPPTGPGRLTLTHEFTPFPWTLGELVQGQTSGAVGTIRIINVAGEALFVNGVAGAFVPGETILGLTSGNSAVLILADPQPTYQIIWDMRIGADDIPEYEWVSVQAAHLNVEGRCNYGHSANYQMQVLTQQFPLDVGSTQSNATRSQNNTDASPLSTQSAAETAAAGDSLASPGSTQSAAETQAITNTSATPTQTQSAAETQAIPKTGETPLSTQSTGDGQFETDVNLAGNLMTEAPGNNTTVQGGGVVGFEDDSGPQGDRDALTVASSPFPGQAWETLSLLPRGPEFAKRLDGLVLLGRVVIDAENDAVNTRYPILDVDAAGLGAPGNPPALLPAASIPGVGVLRVVVRAITVGGAISVQPEIGLGVGGSFDDQVASAQVSLTTDGQQRELPPVATRPLLGAGAVLEAELDVVANTTGSYLIELLVYGFHRVG